MIRLGQIQLVVERNCASHPRINNGTKLPRTGFVSINNERLFTLGSLVLQDPDIGLNTLMQTRERWEHLYGTYKGYLTFFTRQIQTIANGEPLTRLKRTKTIFRS